jgi:hypothetical protein
MNLPSSRTLKNPGFAPLYDTHLTPGLEDASVVPEKNNSPSEWTTTS